MFTDRDYAESILITMLDYQAKAESWALAKMEANNNAKSLQHETLSMLEKESWMYGRNTEREDMELIALLREAADRLEARYK